MVCLVSPICSGKPTVCAAAVEVAVAGGDDPTVIEALGIAVQRGWVRPLLIGPELRIRDIAESSCVSLDGMRLQNAEGEAEARIAVDEVRAGRARILMKGQIATPSLMKAVLDSRTGLRSGRTICQVVLMELPRDGRRFLMADTGICVQPTLEEKADILRSTVEVAQALGLLCPRVALMAATETAKSAMPETVDAQELTLRHAPRRVRGLPGARPTLVRPGLCGRRWSEEANCRRGGGLCRCHAVPEPALGQPDREGDHVHRKLPVWRPAPRREGPGCLHVSRR